MKDRFATATFFTEDDLRDETTAEPELEMVAAVLAGRRVDLSHVSPRHPRMTSA